MTEYGLRASFSQVIKVRHPTLVNTNSTRYGSTKKLGVGKWKKKLGILDNLLFILDIN